MGADMALVDEDDGSEPGWALRAVELRDVRVDLLDTGPADAVAQNLKHPLAVVIDGRRVARVVQHDVSATRSGAAHAQAASICGFQGD